MFWGWVDCAKDGYDQPLEEENDDDLFDEEADTSDYDCDDLDFFSVIEIEKYRVLPSLQRY